MLSWVLSRQKAEKEEPRPRSEQAFGQVREVIAIVIICAGLSGRAKLLEHGVCMCSADCLLRCVWILITI